jgi:hypothetical protein
MDRTNDEPDAGARREAGVKEIVNGPRIASTISLLALLGGAGRLAAQVSEDGVTTRFLEGSVFDVGEITVTAEPEALSPQEAAPQQQPAPPSVQDLGFKESEIRGSLEDQQRLDKRTRMLKIHQRLGLLTLAPMLATIITSGNANERGSASSRNLHGALGLVTAGMYVATATFAIRAPSEPGTKTKGPIKVHKLLAWVHGTGMILTPILGALARSQLDKGEKVHGIASAHSGVATVTYAAYGAAIASVAIKW